MAGHQQMLRDILRCDTLWYSGVSNYLLQIKSLWIINQKLMDGAQMSIHVKHSQWFIIWLWDGWWFLQCMKNNALICTMPEIWNKYRNSIIHISRNDNDKIAETTWINVMIGFKHAVPCIVKSEALRGVMHLVHLSVWTLLAFDLTMHGLSCSNT